MSNDAGIVVITPKSLSEAQQLSATLSKSSLLPEALRGKEAEILMTIMTGAEIGLAPMQSIRAIDCIKGKPTLKAETMTALVRGRRDVCEYLQLVTSTPTLATYETKRVGDPRPTTMSFSAEDAKTAGLISNDNYRKFPAAMLRARCGSAICKAVYSDLLLGLYDPDEIAPEREVTPRASPPSHVVDSVATALPAPVDYDASGVPVSDGAKLEVKVEEAQDVSGLKALVDPLGRLKTSAPEWYSKLRARWGVRHNEMLAAAKVDNGVQQAFQAHVQQELSAQKALVRESMEPGSEG